MSRGYTININLTNMIADVINKKSKKPAGIITFNNYAKHYINSDEDNFTTRKGLLKINNSKIIRILNIVNKYTVLNGSQDNRLLYFITLKENESHVPSTYKRDKTFRLSDGIYYSYVLKNVNCEDCVNCYGCKDCVECEDCYGCTSSFDCQNSISLSDCNSCQDCLKCEDCDNCDLCSNSTLCENCTMCRWCNECTDSEYSINCDNCLKCNRCIKCISCKGCNNIKNKVNLVCEE